MIRIWSTQSLYSQLIKGNHLDWIAQSKLNGCIVKDVLLSRWFDLVRHGYGTNIVYDLSPLNYLAYTQQLVIPYNQWDKKMLKNRNTFPKATFLINRFLKFTCLCLLPYHPQTVKRARLNSFSIPSIRLNLRSYLAAVNRLYLKEFGYS